MNILYTALLPSRSRLGRCACVVCLAGAGVAGLMLIGGR